MKPILAVVPYGENVPERRIDASRVESILGSLEATLEQAGFTWRDVSLLYLANSKLSIDHGKQQDFDQAVRSGLQSFSDKRDWFPSLIGSTVFGSFYSHQGRVEFDIADGLLFVAFVSAALDRVPVSRDISSSLEDRRFAARNALNRAQRAASDELREETGVEVPPQSLAEASVGILLTSGSGHIDQQEAVDFKECYAVGQELLNEATARHTGALKSNVEIVGGCATNRGPGLLQALYYSETIGTRTHYAYTYSHGAVMALLPYTRGRFSLQHPYKRVDIGELEVEFDPHDEYADGRYFYVKTINGKTPIDFLADYWDFTRADLEKLADEHIAIPAVPKAHLVTIASSLSKYHSGIWPNVPVWLEKRDGEILLRLVRAEDEDSNYYLMELGSDLRQAVEHLRPNAASLRRSFEDSATRGDTLLSFLCESRKYVS